MSNEANEENLKKVNQFVEWFKELTGKDMGYSVRAKVITLHNDDDFSDSEDSYECDCASDSNESSDESSECEDCQNRHNKEKNNQLFLKVVREMIEIPSGNQFEIGSIDWEKTAQVCDIVFEKSNLVCTNKTSGKGVSFNFNYPILYCSWFKYFIGSFWMGSCGYNNSNMINWMDQFIEGAFKNDYQLFVSYVLFYAEKFFHDDYTQVDLLENEFTVNDLKCTTNSITIKDCHFINAFYSIDEPMFRSLYEKVKEVYEKVMKEKIKEMEKSLEDSEKKLLREQQEKKEKEDKIASTAAKIAEKRAAVETICGNLKKVKHDD